MDQQQPPLPIAHKFYLVLSVALATVTLFANSARVINIHHHRKPLPVSEALAGALTALTVAHPLLLLSRHSPALTFSVCFGVSSFPLLMSIFLHVTNSTLSMLEKYLTLGGPQCPKLDKTIAGACVGVAWAESTIFATIPWLGWNSWSGRCNIPDIWTPNFTAFAAMAVALHLLLNALMLFRMWIAARRRRHVVNPETNHAGISSEEPPPSTIVDINICLTEMVLLLSCHVPLYCHLLSRMSCSRARLCHQAEDDDVYVWTSLPLLLYGVVNPLLDDFRQNEMRCSTIEWITGLCRRRSYEDPNIESL